MAPPPPPPIADINFASETFYPQLCQLSFFPEKVVSFYCPQTRISLHFFICVCVCFFFSRRPPVFSAVSYLLSPISAYRGTIRHTTTSIGQMFFSSCGTRGYTLWILPLMFKIHFTHRIAYFGPHFYPAFIVAKVMSLSCPFILICLANNRINRI